MANDTVKRRTYRDISKQRESKAREPATDRQPWGMLAFAAILITLACGFYLGALKMPHINLPFGMADAQKPATSGAAISQAYLENTYNAKFLTFTHPVHGFSVNYPAGYSVMSDNIDPEALRFSAEGNDGLLVIVKFVILTNRYTEKDVQNYIAQIPAEMDGTSIKVVNWTLQQYGPNQVYVIRTEQYNNLVGVKVTGTNAFINCPTKSFMLEAGVPQTSISEQKVVDNMLETFKCPS